MYNIYILKIIYRSIICKIYMSNKHRTRLNVDMYKLMYTDTFRNTYIQNYVQPRVYLHFV